MCRLPARPAPPQVLFRQLKFRNYPFEWVYDGLDPALLHKVVYRRKGMPLSLGSLCVLVGARLGIFLEMKGQPTPPIQLPAGCPPPPPPPLPFALPLHAHTDLRLPIGLVSMPEVVLQPCVGSPCTIPPPPPPPSHCHSTPIQICACR